jgi:hypothetical protein
MNIYSVHHLVWNGLCDIYSDESCLRERKIEGGMSMRGLKGIIVGDTARSASKQQPTPIFLPFSFFLSVFFGEEVE